MPDHESADARIAAALAVARQSGQTDGSEHRLWVIDQMVRALCGPEYPAWVAASRAGEDGPSTYPWNTGTAP